MLIDLSEVLSDEGLTKSVPVHIELAGFTFKGMSYAVARADDFELTMKNEGKQRASLSGSASVTLRLVCDRCLSEFDREFPVDIDVLVGASQSSSDETDETDELSYFEDGNIDMDALISKELMSMIPIQVLCREDCKGLCKVCGTNLNYGTCDCDDFVPDPRLSVFSDILKK